jgi:tRNA (mo5U34)-methyltransferase
VTAERSELEVRLRHAARRVRDGGRRAADVARVAADAARAARGDGYVPAPAVGRGGRTPPFRLRDGLDRETFAKDLATREWYHSFDFDGGIVAEGRDNSHDKTQYLGLLDSMDGLRVLDVGAFDGHYSFEAARRGAAEVVAADHFVWTWPGSTVKSGFDLIRDALDMNDVVRDVTVTVEDMTPESVGGEFDVVLFLGVLYHAPDPLGYLKRLRAVTRGHAIIETVADLFDVRRPALAYYPGEYLNHDASNHFGPNMPALKGLLSDAGFSRVDDLGAWRYHEVEQANGARRPAGGPRSGRVVVRAWP